MFQSMNLRGKMKMNTKELKRKWIDFCLTFADAYEDCPFDDETVVVRHRKNKKIFALFFEREGEIWINFKGDPMQSDLWRKVYSSVTAGYHMNKIHWNTVKIPGDVPEEEVKAMLSESHFLTKPKK